MRTPALRRASVRPLGIQTFNHCPAPGQVLLAVLLDNVQGRAVRRAETVSALASPHAA